MKIITIGLCAAGVCAAAVAVLWLSADAPADGAAVAVSPAPSANSSAASTGSTSGMWAWGMGGNRSATGAADKTVHALLAQALTATRTSGEGDAARDQLRKLAKQDPEFMKQLMQSYDKEANPQARQLIVALLADVEKPEILAFSKRLAASSDVTQRKDGLSMLQNRASDSPEARAVILQSLARDKSPEVVTMALAALRPPAEGAPPDAKDAAAVVTQLRELAKSADPNIRLQSLMQLAQWDKSDGSQEQWTQALADQSPQVRQAAVTAIAQSGTKSDAVKAALFGLANNERESKDVRASALQALERFDLSRDEAANIGRLRAAMPGL